MVVVVRVDEDGRTCDASCYDAKRLGCTCTCGGKNHGLGLAHALRVEGLSMDDEDMVEESLEADAVSDQDQDFEDEDEEEDEDEDFLDDDDGEDFHSDDGLGSDDDE